jgi:hypothetical protein
MTTEILWEPHRVVMTLICKREIWIEVSLLMSSMLKKCFLSSWLFPFLFIFFIFPVAAPPDLRGAFRSVDDILQMMDSQVLTDSPQHSASIDGEVSLLCFLLPSIPFSD